MALKFVSLHNHDGHSLYDAIGGVQDYVNFLLKNAGEDSGAYAISNHGNLNSIGEAVSIQKKNLEKGIPAKIIFGVEFYYIPSLVDWQHDKNVKDTIKKEEKEAKKKSDDEEVDASELVIEDEKESKSKNYFYDPVYRRNHLVVCAMNREGLQNLFRLVSKSYREGFYKKPRIDLEMLRKHNSGLIASTACVAGIPSWCSSHPDRSELNKLEIYDKELLPLMDIFGKDRFFFELQFNKLDIQRTVNLDLIEYSKHTGYNLIVTCDAHYPSPELWKERELYKMLGYQMKKQDIDKSMLEKKIEELDVQLYLKNGDQVFQAYKDTFAEHFKDEKLIKEAIERTYEIAHSMCDTVLPDGSYKLPKTFKVTEKVKTPFDRLKELTLQGLKDKKKNTKEYMDRAAFELQVIKKIGVEEYFLTKREIVQTLKEHMLVGPARGSAGGSLVCYLIGITNIDPIAHNLLFERFMSTSRKEMPDIDSDFELKDQALDILKGKFGDENVLAISNYNRLQLKSLVKDIAKLYDVPFEEVNNVTKIMESEAKDKIMEEIGHDQKLYELTFERCKQHSPTFNKFIEQYPKVGLHIENLYQEIKSTGRHAGGTLIVPDAEGCLPIIRIRGIDQSPIPEGITAQYLQYFGLIKFDVLGLATLKIIRKCIEEILKDHENTPSPTIEQVWEYYDKYLHPDVIDGKDQRVFENVYHKGNWPSIFQFAEKNVQNFCVQAKPTSVEDISAITALWRPGPLKGQADKRYLYYDEHKFKQEHPIIQEILGDTRGVLLYQEQFMLMAHKLAGFSLEEANKLRKLLVKPATSLAEEMKRERIEIGNKFINGCVEKGLSEKRAQKLWNEEILGFISYGFNKSHSVAYAFNSYQCAFLYTYYPQQWVKACLEQDPDLEKTINVVKGLGFKISKPDINHSSAREWHVLDDNTCVPALVAVKGIGVTAADELVNTRPRNGFTSLKNFFFDDEGYWRWSKLNKKSLEALIQTEAFNSVNAVGQDSIFKNYKHLYNTLFESEQVDKKNFKLDKLKRDWANIEKASVVVSSDDWSTVEKVNMQRELLGFYDKNLIIGKFLKTFKEFGVQAIDDTEDKQDKRKVWALIETIQKKETKAGKEFLVVGATGNTDKMYSFRVWQPTDIWKEGSVLIIDLTYQDDFGYSVPRQCKPLKISK